MPNQPFNPFFERMTDRFPIPILGKVLVSIVLGFGFLAVHYAAARGRIFEDWSWFLGVLIGTAMLTVYYATHTLRSLMNEMHRLGAHAEGVAARQLGKILTDKRFVVAGAISGIANCVFGYLFGLIYTTRAQKLTILSGYFLAGFICGMAVLGILGSTVAIAAICKQGKLTLDFTSPDGCGGTMFIGEALVIFAAVTLTVGVAISVYILKTPWLNPDIGWIRLLKYGWIAFPYVMSLAAFLMPAVPINKALTEYKIEQEDLIRAKLDHIRQSIEEDKIHGDPRKDLFQAFDFQSKNRKDLHSMRTWPYGLGANLTYAVFFAGNLFASVRVVTDWLDKVNKLKS